MHVKRMQGILLSFSVANHKDIVTFGLQTSSQQFLMILSFVFVVLFNKSFFTAAWHIQEINSLGKILFFISLVPLLWLLTLSFLNFLCLPGIVKPICIIMLVGGAFAAYFMDSYGVVIDKEMLRNVLETDSQEVRNLYSVKLIAYVVGIGVLPSWLIIKTKINWKTYWRELIVRATTLIISLVVSSLLIISLSDYYSSFFRNHKDVRLLANPLGFVNAAISLLNEKMRKPIIVESISNGATLGAGTLQQQKPVLIIFVVGETARSANFGLGGYFRDTTPLLAKQNIIYFDNFSSCGTSTAVSVPCMFSSLSRSEYSASKARLRHSLLDFISVADVDVLWRDNNSGCKGTCDRVSYESFDETMPEQWCIEDNCYDEVLLHNLEEKITGRNQFIVLHQKGSHGPAYDQRYPDAMRHFTPVCTTNQLHDCSTEEVVNAYDNSIRYTDYFLYQVILWLIDHQNTFNTSMIYVSDHGESLGENRMYLHGMPYTIAPSFQKQVPFVFWASEGFYRDRRLSRECLSNIRTQSFSHDNIFHSFIGLLDIKTEYYDQQMDIFAACIKQR